MGFWDRLFGDREPSGEREQREREAQVVREQMAPAPESEIRREKKFAVVLGENGKLEKREIMDIDPETGEVTIRGENGRPEHLTHEKFWQYNFSKSGEMLDELIRERKEVAGRGYHGIKGEKEARARGLARFDQIIEAFKKGELGPMRDFFADDEHLARLEQEAAGVERHRKEDLQKKEEELRALEAKEEFLDGLENQLTELTEKEAELIAGRARIVASDRGIYEEKIVENRKAQEQLKKQLKKVKPGMTWDVGWKKAVEVDLERLRKPSPVRPELQRMRDFVRILDQQISARRKRKAA